MESTMNRPKAQAAEIVDAEVVNTDVVKINNTKRDLSKVSETDKTRLAALAKNIDVKDVNSVLNYGCELQTAIGRSNALLKQKKSSSAGEIGELIPQVVNELNSLDIDAFQPSSPIVRKTRSILSKIPIIRHLVQTYDKLEAKSNEIAKNVDNIAKKMEALRLSTMQDNNTIEVAIQENCQYKTQLEDLIIAGKMKLKEIDAQIDTMKAHSDEYESYEINAVEQFRNNLDRRLGDMEVMHYTFSLSIPQYQTIQQGNIAMATKAHTLTTTTIPLWKNQLGMAVELKKQENNIKAIRCVTDATNEIISKNAELLKQNSIAIAKENERSVVDVETLRESTQKFIETIQSIKEIQEEGAAKRLSLENDLKNMNNEIGVYLEDARALGTALTPTPSLEYSRS